MSARAATPPARVVIYRLGSLGDTIVALPSLHRVVAAFPTAERVMLTNVPVSAKAAPLEAILENSGMVDRFIAYPVGTRSVAALRRLRTELRALGADTLVYLTPPRGRRAAWRDWLFFRLCGFRRIVGAPLTADLQHNRVGADGCVERECNRLARCIAVLGPVSFDDPAAWDLRLTEAELDAGASALGDTAALPRISINMGGKVAANDWGEANWAALISRLGAEARGHALVIVGAAEDDARAGRIAALWDGPVANLCGQVRPRVSAAAMQGSRLFIGHDSGPLHLAGSRNVPCIGLYGDTNLPRKWHLYGERHRLIHDLRGVRSISVDQVVEAARALLAAPAVLHAGDASEGPAR